MTINYSIDHKLLQLPVFTDKSGHLKRALLISLSLIQHFTTNAGTCIFYQSQLAEDWDITDRYFRDALRLLIDHKLIKLVKSYDRKAQTPAVYVASTGSRRGVSKQYTPGTQAVDATSRVNNIKLLKGDGANTPPPFTKESTSSDLESEYYQQQLKNKNN
tara:strand:+ start:609 stop:1088 length:480 start_codon:yes stop_codon:yes gene_type:complete